MQLEQSSVQITYATCHASAGAAAKLSHVAEKFSTFYSEIEQERQARRHQEATRHQQAQESLSHLEAFVKV